VVAETPKRSARVESGWSETFLDHERAGSCDLAESVANGHSILQVHSLASPEEARRLKVEAIFAADRRMNDDPEESCQTEQRIVALRAAYLKADQPWRSSSAFSNRNPCVDRLPLCAFPASAAILCDALLLRALSVVNGQIDDQLTRQLFGDCLADATSCEHNPRLRFATGEPAINVYSLGGTFKPHEDREALTILVPLSGASDYDGGGTAFWSTSDAGPGGSVSLNNGRTVHEPTLVLRPLAGSAIIFCGDVTHAGQACTGGRRCIFVASFSPMMNKSQVPTIDEDVARRNAAVTKVGPGRELPPMRNLPSDVQSAPGGVTARHKRMAEILSGRT